ncbi:hypothetical protein [Stutzerimonas nitrititolerans]|uniref:hypothetical protein n=1 Tax=Stutzerimonas nitrititolerans TaxID=2482751 RepID=UPI001482AC51|nr:hypothetical protein [Stutzerimonas nitrititolerans]NNT92605.1 hypothetical protein [Stutzerimonas nitrititolerans]
MQEILLSAWLEIKTWDWPGIIQSITGIATLAIACIALTSWRHQHRSQATTRLLDELTDSVYEFIQSISPAEQMLMVIRIGIDSQQFNRNLNKELEHSLTVAYIETEGKEAAERLMSILKNAEQPARRIRLLLLKGHVLGIKNYDVCYNACNMIAWQLDRLMVVATILSSPYMNWTHPRVIANLENMMKITPEDISSILTESQNQLTEFLKDTYSKEYKSA